MPLLRVALVGCGLISDAHIRAYAKHADRARITVCCDVDRAKAEDRAAVIGGGARAVTDYADVLADPDVDAVELCTPHHLHSEAVIAAARAGKHVMCQKPLAKTLAECDAMIAACREAGVVLFYGETNRTRLAAVAAKRAIDEGRIGRLVGLQATYAHWQGGAYLSTAWRYDPAVSGGGQLLDGGIHYVNMLHQIGGPVEAVSCFTTRFRPELGGEDTATLTLRFAGGHLGTLFSSQAAGVWYPDTTFAAFGTEGVLTLGGPLGALCLHRPDLPERREVLIERGGDDFVTMTGRYLDTVLDGAPNPAPGEVGREDLRLVLAAYESARWGREVRPEEMEGSAT
jgi:Predicted dehydrogenases and related proteins